MTDISALERKSLESLSHMLHGQSHHQINLDSFLDSCKTDLSQLCFSYKNAELCGVDLHPDFIAFLQDRMTQRVHSLAKFYGKLSLILNATKMDEHTNVTFLNGDSHNSAQRPVLLESRTFRAVLKLTDPRTTIIYNSLLRSVQEDRDLPSYAQVVKHDSSYQFQISPYLEHSNNLSSHATELYGHMLGTHLAICYFLQMTDLHFENVLTSEGIPYVIDTECMLYGFYGHPTPSDFRLMNTGLIAPKKSLSGIAGGDGDVFNLELHIDETKQVRYTQRNIAFHNRLTDNRGEIIQTIKYKKNIISGFRETFIFLLTNKLSLLNKIPTEVILKFRTRFLFRTTAHYKTVVDRIYSPSQKNSHSSYLESTLSSFCGSGFLPEKIHDLVIVKEINDLLNGDIPFFWAGSASNKIFHKSGISMRYELIPSLRSRIDNAILSFVEEDLEPLSALLEDHL